MSISDKNVIDLVGINKIDEVVLSISDHLNWENTYEHLFELQEKLNRYIHFIESGEIFDAYPKSYGRKILIEIISKYEYTIEAKEFLEKAKPTIHSIGADLRQRVLE